MCVTQLRVLFFRDYHRLERNVDFDGLAGIRRGTVGRAWSGRCVPWPRSP